MTDKHAKATRQILEHIDRVRTALEDFRTDGISPEGTLMRPQFQGASLRIAHEELLKAIAVFERTKWK